MKKQKIDIRFGVLSLLVFLTAFSRLIPHPPNFAPVSAMALFGAAYFSKKHIAIIIPIVAMWFSDLFINNVVYGRFFDSFVWFYSGFYWTYAAFIIIGFVGFALLKKIKTQSLIIASILASTLFFIISNFGVWFSGTMYPNNFSGLIACYTAAIPFFKNTIMGDFVYCGVLFSVFEFAQYKIPTLKLTTN